MRRRLLAAAAGLLLVASSELLLVGPPASAAEQQPVGSGWTCGFAARDAGAGRYSGVVTGGPWAGPSNDTRVTIRCIVEVLGQAGRYVAATVDSGAQPAAAVLPPQPVSFGSPPRPGFTAEIWMCTEVIIDTDDSTPLVYRYDADHDMSNGAQCAEASPTGGDPTLVVAAPEHVDGDVCVYAEVGALPPPDNWAKACAPTGKLTSTTSPPGDGRPARLVALGRRRGPARWVLLGQVNA